MPYKRRPWGQIEKSFVEEGLSLTELSQRWNVPKRTLQTHSTRDGWVEKRRRYQQAFAVQRDSLLEQMQTPLSDRTAEHWAVTRMAVEAAKQALSCLKQEVDLSAEHEAAERGKDPGSVPALAALAPVMREWVWILDRAVRLERELLALQYEHPAKAIQYLLKLGYEVHDLSAAVATGAGGTSQSNRQLPRGRG